MSKELLYISPYGNLKESSTGVPRWVGGGGLMSKVPLCRGCTRLWTRTTPWVVLCGEVRRGIGLLKDSHVCLH